MRTLGNVTTLAAADATATGTVVNVSGYNHAAFQVTGTFVADVTFKASLDGVTWVDAYGHNLGDAGHALVKKVTAPGIVQFRELGGVQFLRADVTAYTSGEVTALVNAVA
jgi:hypothetical protein